VARLPKPRQRFRSNRDRVVVLVLFLVEGGRRSGFIAVAGNAKLMKA
jgi:hypothetical protein